MSPGTLLPLLLNLALVPSLQTPLQTVPLYFGSKTVYVSAPRQKEQQFESYSYRNIIYNKGKTQAAIRWCYFWNKYVTCQVTVTNGYGKTQALPDSDIEQFIFTPDGRYLVGIGTGNHTLMLWTLGRTIAAPKVKTLVNMRVTDLQVSEHELCIAGSNAGSFYVLLNWPDLSSVAVQKSA
ncbi:hypothetical protein, partial [Deinococcus sp.]|uniref:hypothetical protein n=1 Tax=Deinococcus sp. TaxID=47478 RepID=UPI0025CE6961